MMITWGVLVALIAAIPAPGPFPDLDHDPKLVGKVTIAGEGHHRVGELLSSLAHKVGVQIVAQGDFLNQPATVEVKDRSARDVMTDLALAANATWVKRKGTYLLVEKGPMAGMIRWGGNPQKGIESAFQLAGSLTAAQIQRLRAGQPIPLQEMRPDQQAAFTTAYNMEYFEHPERYPKDVFVREVNAQIVLYPASNGQPDRIGLCISRLSSEPGLPLTPPLAFMAVQYPPRRTQP